MSDYRKALADHWLDEMRSRSTAASRVLIVWLAFLLLVWLGGIEPHFEDQVAPYVSALADKRATDQTIETLRSAGRGAQAESQNATKLQEAVDTRRKAAQVIKFPIPGFTDIEVRAVRAPLVWTLFALGLIGYLLSVRSAALRLASGSLRIHSVELSTGQADLEQYASGLAWWMAPVPWRDGQNIQAHDLQRFLGRDRSLERRQTFWVAVGFASLVIAQGRMVYLMTSASDGLFDGTFERIVTVSLQLGVLATTLTLFFRWFSIAKVPDELAATVSANGVTRRGLLLQTTVIITAIAGLPTGRWLASASKRIRHRRPYFVLTERERSRGTNLQAGFFINPRSSIYHYVSNEGRIRIPDIVAESRFIRVDASALLAATGANPPRVHLARSSVSFESAALAALSGGDVDASCSLLLAGLTHSLQAAAGSPSYRLADLLAGLAVRHNRGEFLRQLIDRIARSQRAETFAPRIAKWTDVKSRWRVRWLDRSRQTSWAGVPM